MRKRYPIEQNPLLRPGVFVWLAALILLGVLTIFSPFIAMIVVPVVALVFLFGDFKTKPRGE